MTSAEYSDYDAMDVSRAAQLGAFPTTLHADGLVVHDTAGRVVATFSNLWQAEALVSLVDDSPNMFGAWADVIDALVECQEKIDEQNEKIGTLEHDLREAQQEATDLRTRLALVTREKL